MQTRKGDVSEAAKMRGEPAGTEVVLWGYHVLDAIKVSLQGRRPDFELISSNPRSTSILRRPGVPTACIYLHTRNCIK